MSKSLENRDINDSYSIPGSIWWKAIKKGQYMGGTIKPHRRHRTCKCGGSYKSRKEADYKFPVPRCTSCNAAPTKLIVRTNLPGIGVKDIAHSLSGDPLTKLPMADALLVEIHAQIENRTLNLEQFLSPNQREKYRIGYLVRSYIRRKEQSRGNNPHADAKGCSPAYIEDAKKLYKNHLVPAFGKMYIRDLNYIHLARLSGDRSWWPQAESQNA